MPHDDPNDPHHHPHDPPNPHAPGDGRPAHDAGHAHTHDAGHAHAHDAGPARGVPVLPDNAGRGRVLYVDAFAGAAGDMLVGALLDLGVPVDPIRDALAALPIHHYEVGSGPAHSHAISATRFHVRVTGEQPRRDYRDIRAMLDAAPLAPSVRRRALDAFKALAVAEGKIHRIDPEHVHFHEVGAVDAIVDIVAASAGFAWLGAEVVCSPLPMGHGFVRAEHGVLPLPAPAVVEILRGVPTVYAGIEAELVTPTGAAVLVANATRFERWPPMRPVRTGFGAGTRTLPDRPNLVRLVLGDPAPTADADAGAGGGVGAKTLAVVESNVDDASGEIIAHAIGALLRGGALDAWGVPVVMKKGRPGVTVCALGTEAQSAGLARLMMSECATLGARVYPVTRWERTRRVVSVATRYGEVALKVADGEGLVASAKPEYEDVARLAEAHGVPARVVQGAALAAWRALAEARDTAAHDADERDVEAHDAGA